MSIFIACCSQQLTCGHNLNIQQQINGKTNYGSYIMEYYSKRYTIEYYSKRYTMEYYFKRGKFCCKLQHV